VLGRNVEASADPMRSWIDQVSGPTDAAAALADRVASLTSSAERADGGIRVTVAGSGNLIGLELPTPGLAEEILRTMRQAQAGLTDRVAEAVAETVGADSETGRTVLNSFAQRFPIEPPVEPVMPTPSFPTFQSRATLPHQPPGGGFESGRDSRAR
jgi:hypothetical protein